MSEKQSVLITDINFVKNHIRNRPYMSGIERDKIRKLHSSEYFTPFEKVIERLDAYNNSVWVDATSQFLDPTCGDGQFLGEVLIRKMENGSTFEQALSTVYGVDLMIDNVDLCRERLLCGREDLRHIVEQNIYQADGLKFSYEFKPMSETRRKREANLRKKAEKAKKQAEKAKQEQEFKDRASKLLGLQNTNKKGKKQLVDQ